MKPSNLRSTWGRSQGEKPQASEDTICALATAPGGALGIIRVSGPDAFPIVSSLCPLCCDSVAANTIHHTHITAPSPIHTTPPPQPTAEVIDDVLVSVFRAPHSYTGEDSVEISCHGSPYILNKVLSLLVEHGCRMANPGEYTMRAYLNGKLDLSQAEAVADLIASTNRATHQMAMSQLRGGISSELSTLRDQLLQLTSLLELELDFSDHEDLEFADRTELLVLAQTIDARITTLAGSFERGQALKQGIPVAIVGKTNVGKSTLLNRLLGDDRAIVSDIHGTTRDTIEDTIDIHGVQFRFIDTAGLRHTDDKIEQIGIDRTYQAIGRARIVLWLVDTPPTPTEVADMTARCSAKSLLLVHNKADLHPAPGTSTLLPPSASPLPVHAPATSPISDTSASPVPDTSTSPVLDTPALSPVCCDSIAALPSLSISAKQGTNLPALESAIYRAADLPTLSDSDTIVTNARHYDALTCAHAHLQRVLDGLSPLASSQTQLASHQKDAKSLAPQTPPDLLAEDLRQVLDTLAEITGGQITPQETLNSIFSSFCVGK